MRMKFNIIPILIISIMASISIVSGFGIGSMNHDNNHPCAMLMVSGSDCLSASNFALALHHISGLKNFSQSILNINLFS